MRAASLPTPLSTCPCALKYPQRIPRISHPLARFHPQPQRGSVRCSCRALITSSDRSCAPLCPQADGVEVRVFSMQSQQNERLELAVVRVHCARLLHLEPRRVYPLRHLLRSGQLAAPCEERCLVERVGLCRIGCRPQKKDRRVRRVCLGHPPRRDARPRRAGCTHCA